MFTMLWMHLKNRTNSYDVNFDTNIISNKTTNMLTTSNSVQIDNYTERSVLKDPERIRAWVTR